MESAAFRELVDKIDRISSYVKKSEEAKAGDKQDVWLYNDDLTALLEVSERTLQRMRDKGLIRYAINGGRCRYHIKDVEAYIQSSFIKVNPESLEEFKQNYLLRTRSNKQVKK